MNKERYDRLIAHIEASPEQWNQSRYYDKVTVGYTVREGDCGTACCFAGWAVKFSLEGRPDPKADLQYLRKVSLHAEMHHRAMKWLELEPTEARYLFDANRTWYDIKAFRARADV